MDLIQTPSHSAFGYDFEDLQTRLELNLIEDLQKIDVFKSISFPQLVVVGDQSTGKSSVLQAVTGIPFPINDQTCTLFAIEISFQKTLFNEPTIVEISIDPSADEPPERKEALLSWKPKNFNPAGTLDKITVKDIFQQAKNIIINSTTTTKRYPEGSSRLSSSTLRITRRGPRETNFTIVDVPGLDRGHETHLEQKTARSLVKHYLDNPRSIVVVVINVVNPERQEIFQMLRDMPDKESRVIGVINKCDTKQNQLDDWVFGLIHNKDQSQSGCCFKEGWYGLRNRQPSELSITDSERDKLEEELFATEAWKDLPQDKLGRNNLKGTLIKMRNAHVKRSLPDVLHEIQTKLDICITRIGLLGSRTPNEAQFVLINRVATEYSKMAEDALSGQYKIVTDKKLFARTHIRSNLNEFYNCMEKGGIKFPFNTPNSITSLFLDETVVWEKLEKDPAYIWIWKAIASYRGKEQSHEVSLSVKTLLWKQQVSSWEGIAYNALQKFQTTLDSVHDRIFEVACPDKILRTKLRQWVKHDLMKALEAAKEELQCLLNDEENSSLFTFSPERRLKRELLGEARLTALPLESSRPSSDHHPQALNPILKANNVNTGLQRRYRTTTEV
ncbi:hypothetical protein V498_07992 [Pseudogymnoascus sp. VKM F-4517 (FW-2822)]|nr:hypothetical protein V498_07992 [Pseudogymnoascus sp. VKM F-4517 (FW-2822)]